ncbi:hypothetical protein GCM10009846_12460 [Agrococcus versicolor]|uniref:Vitamin K epoxide reductase domain-containing protein n=1 Tax=Agrococcus versicolor TaxID=501482 RepID=A0ABN3ANW4_9MICO
MATKQTARIAPTDDAAAPAAAPTGYLPPLWLAIVLAVTGAAGLLAAFTLAVERVHLLEDPEATLGCDISPLVTCSGVMAEPQARVFLDIPNPFFGIICFTAVLVMAALALGRVRLPRWIWTTFTVGVLLGLVFALWLWQQSVFVLGVVCPWCFLVYMTMSALAPTLTIWAIGSGAVPAPAPVRRVLAHWGEWSWVVSLLLAMTIVLAIVLRLPDIPRFLILGY